MNITKFSAAFFTLFMLSAPMWAQKKNDVENIKKLCGCFDVEFKYAETFAPDEEYKYHNRERITQATEWVVPVEETKNRIVLQHLLVINDTMVIKHWREDWEFEKPVLLSYAGDHVWNKQQLAKKHVKNKWTQTVWEVSDAPRYQGASEWIVTDKKVLWMNTTDAPLPRREYTKRNDYNVLRRRNMISVAENGWLHEQDNQKIIRKNGKDSLLAEEKGVNTYTKIDESKCQAAKKYWDKNKVFWEKVKAVWDEYLSKHDSISLKPLVNDIPMHQRFFEVEQNYSSEKITLNDVTREVKAILDTYATVNFQ